MFTLCHGAKFLYGGCHSRKFLQLHFIMQKIIVNNYVVKRVHAYGKNLNISIWFQVRNELSHRVSVWKTRRDVSSSSTARRHILMSTQSAKEVHDTSQDPPEELKKKPAERSSLLDDVFPTEATKGSDTSSNTGSKIGWDGDDGPGKDDMIVANSWDSIGYV